VCSIDSALEFLANGRLANLKITAELGSCLLHRKGRLTVDSCALECVDHPLDHLSYPIMSTADDQPCPITNGHNEVSVIETRIEGGLRCVNTGDKLKLQQVFANKYFDRIQKLSLQSSLFSLSFGPRYCVLPQFKQKQKVRHES
jgi:hypothetical protein